MKSRFSQRIYRVVSPLSGNSSDAWKDIVRNALVPKAAAAELAASGFERDREWLKEWETLIDVGLASHPRTATLTNASTQTVIQDETVQKAAQRVCELTTDVRIMLRSFVSTVGEPMVMPNSYDSPRSIPSSNSD